MKILFLCHQLPTLSRPSTLRVLFSIKYLVEKYGHDITLLAFKIVGSGERYHDLSKYCEIESIEIHGFTNVLSLRAVMYTIKNMLSLENMFSKNPTLLTYFYSPKMHRKLKEMLKTNKFDFIFISSYSMFSYILNTDINIPKVMEVWAASPINEIYKKLLKNPLWRLYYRLQDYKIRNYERKYGEKVDVCITVSLFDRDILKSSIPNLKIVVIPYGVDTEYLKPIDIEEDFSSLIFTGNMARQLNVNMALFFYREIYPLIKKNIPKVKFYIVGRNPTEELLQLTSDESVIVTGYVRDIRPYLSQASIVVMPFYEGFGVKTRILEAMAMGKPVVSTSVGIQAIDVTPGENIIIADNPEEFARRVIELLNDKELRERIGTNARKRTEEKYSWERMTDMLNEVFQKVVNGR